jgi:hypothetical protein
MIVSHALYKAIIEFVKKLLWLELPITANVRACSRAGRLNVQPLTEVE